MNLTKRLLAVIMAIIMVLGIMPAAMAEPAEGEGTECSHEYGSPTWDTSTKCGTQKGVIVCSKCKDTKNVTRDVPHSYGTETWKDGKAPACGETGYMVKKCINCGDTKESKYVGEHSFGDHFFRHIV